MLGILSRIPLVGALMRLALRLARNAKRRARLLLADADLGNRTWVLEQQIIHLRDQLDLHKCKSELDVDERDRILTLRARWRHSHRPLVSVCIATYNRSNELLNRSLPSILGQTYDNIEVIVVGDGCTDDTFARLAELRDSRITCVNIPRSTGYPDDPLRRWMVAGAPAMNRALSLCRGDYITHLDDDDEHLPERIHDLVLFAASNDCDLVWHPFWYQDERGIWQLLPANDLSLGQVTTSSLLYRSWLGAVLWDLDAHWLMEPGDWNRVRRMKFFNPRAMRYPQPLLRHYRERQNTEAPAKAA